MSRVLGSCLAFAVLALAPQLVAGAAARDLESLGSGIVPATASGCLAGHHSCAVVALASGAASTHQHTTSRRSSPVSLRVSAGYFGQYRVSAWVPVRVTVRNRSPSLIEGTIAISDNGPQTQFSIPAYTSLYQSSMILPAGSTKTKTLYLPGHEVG